MARRLGLGPAKRAPCQMHMVRIADRMYLFTDQYAALAVPLSNAIVVHAETGEEDLVLVLSKCALRVNETMREEVTGATCSQTG